MKLKSNLFQSCDEKYCKLINTIAPAKFCQTLTGVENQVTTSGSVSRSPGLDSRPGISYK